MALALTPAKQGRQPRRPAPSRECLAVIPARGGSKGVPRKNLRLLAGKPLIAWTIEAALGAPSLRRVIVSTDDPEIAQVARRWGADVPFRRPSALARDETPGIEPVLHAVEWLAQHGGYQPDEVLLLQPTSPLRTARDIEAAIRLGRQTNADAVVSVTPVHEHPYWTKQLEPDGRLTSCAPPEEAGLRRQELPPRYVVNGAIYLVRSSVLLAAHTFYTERTYGYVMPRERSLDIDTSWDFRLAELVLQNGRRHERD
jgi:N-acylneuraminate cytidylyltransferase/CMP-N,N'-diacetyllegionaminic acid synthase